MRQVAPTHQIIPAEYEQFQVDKDPLPVDEGTPIFRNIHFNDIAARRIRAAAGFLHGLPEMPIEGITSDNVILAASDAPDLYPGKPAMMHLLESMTGAGSYCAHVQRVEFHNIQVQTRTGPALIVEKARDVEIDGFKMKQPHADAPVIDLREVNGALIRGCSAARGTNAFLRISGAPTRGILLSGNDLGRAKENIALEDGARVEALL